MLEALRCKFLANEELHKLLMATDPYPLVSVKPDKYWGAGQDGTGLNRLGQLLMELRSELSGTSGAERSGTEQSGALCASQ